MVTTVTLKQTAYAGMQRQWQADYAADRRGKHAEAVGRQIPAIST
jgi:hypothetical protein